MMACLLSLFWGCRKKRPVYKKAPEVGKTNANVLVDKKSAAAIPDHVVTFAQHLSKYNGETITVFVAGGGPSGTGFTGVLLNTCNVYIKLLIRIGSAPAYIPGNSCTCSFRQEFSSKLQFPNNFSGNVPSLYFPGSIAYIPVDKIVSFVHNAI